MFTGDSGEIITEVPIPASMVDDFKATQRTLTETLAEVDDHIGEKFLMEEQPTPQEVRLALLLC